MSRLKIDYEKQLNRKFKRNITFDSAREFNQIICERDGLRELSKTFRFVLSKLAKCVANCEDDLNNTIAEEVQRYLLASNHTLDDEAFVQNDPNQSVSNANQSNFVLNATLSNSSFNRARLCVPDVQGIIELIEDPNLLQYISKHNASNVDDFDVNECLERLNKEAAYLLTLSEDLGKREKRLGSESSGAEKSDSCCEAEDGSKLAREEHRPNKFTRAHSLNEQHLSTYVMEKPAMSATAVDHATATRVLTSLPPDLNHLHNVFARGDDCSDITTAGNASELNFQLVELKNRLIKSESDRNKLQQELENTITRNTELGHELEQLRDQLSQFNSLNHTEYTEGYGLGVGHIKTSPTQESNADKSLNTFTQLQERARYLLATPPAPTSAQQQQQQQQQQLKQQLLEQQQTKEASDSTIVLLQMIEDFCREGDKVVESNKKDREDLQAQIDTADKQLKATRQFLEEQAAEREQERDEFLREIKRLKAQLRDVEKERSSYANASEEFEQLESQIREHKQELKDAQAKRDKFEVELKASIDKIFVLREIISDLETQVETKALNEHVLGEKIKQLEEFINSQSRSNETLQNEVQSLKVDIEEGYQARIRMLEEKLQNVRPTAEQSMVMDQVVEQLRDIENTLEQKTRALESLHHASASNSCSLSATEDVSVHGSRPASLKIVAAIVSPPQGSPVHPSPRQHSFTMESVQRVMEKLAKHTRVEEAAVKRILDLDMQLTQIRNAHVELQQERDCLQERMCEQTQRISALQSRLEEQRQRAEDLQRANTTDLNIRIHDLQNEVQILRETLSNRDKQLMTMKQQLEKSKVAIDRLEAELLVEQNPDRSQVERLETEIKQKNNAIQKLKEKIKNEMINKLALPDLMETMLADKNDEIDHLREQLEAKERELQATLEFNLSQASSLGGKNISNNLSQQANENKENNGNSNLRNTNTNTNNNSNNKEDGNTKLSARTLSDIVSISEYDEPDVVRRAALQQGNTPLLLPDGSVGVGFMLHNNTMDCSKEVNANLTHKRTEDLSGFMPLQPINTFEHPHYFQDPNIQATGAAGTSAAAARMSSTTLSPGLVPRHINFSDLTDDSKLKTPNFGIQTPEQMLKRKHEMQQLQQLQQQLAALQNEKELLQRDKASELQIMQHNLTVAEERLNAVQTELLTCQQEMQQLKQLDAQYVAQFEEKNKQIEELLRLQRTQREQLTKQEKEINNYRENEQQYQQRIEHMEQQQLQATAKEVEQRDSLRKELYAISETHAQCKYVQQDAATRKKEIEQLNQEVKAKDERLLLLSTKLTLADENIADLQRQVAALELEVEQLGLQLKQQQKQQQHQNSEGSSSRQFSVDEIAQQVEKELNYSAQLDSNILKAIESEEENNFDCEQRRQLRQQKAIAKALTATALTTTTRTPIPTTIPAPILPKTESTDDENFAGERDLLNQIEALRAQIVIEREQSETIRQELLCEKQHSQDIQEQDVVIIEAMRKRLENSLEKEDELHKQLDIERERCDRLQTQLTALQRSESRRNSSLLLKSPNDSPRKSPRQHSDFESELAERLRSEIKMLSAQNERERERCTDVQRSTERERQRYDLELQERIDYCERLKKEMDKLVRDKEAAEMEIEHLQERLTLQTSEIESLEARLVTLQEAETRRTSRSDRHQKETTQLLVELQEIKARLIAGDSEREQLTKTITQLRFDVERSSAREVQLADALANANAQLANAADATATVPQQFLQKMKEINSLLAENTQENRQMAETVQFLVEERRQLQKKCDDLEQQLHANHNVTELEERCNYLFGRYLRVESHRKALVYQKRYLKLSLQRYQDNEQRICEHMQATMTTAQLAVQEQTRKKKLFKTVALAIRAIQRIKYIGRNWQTGKRIVSKSVFTITQQKRTQPPVLSCPVVSSSKQHAIEAPTSPLQINGPTTTSSPFRILTDRMI